MKSLSRILLSGIGMFLIVLTTLFSPGFVADAATTSSANHNLDLSHLLSKGPATLLTNTSQLLHQPINPPTLVTIVQDVLGGLLLGTPTPAPTTTVTGCQQPTIDLKVLVIAADGNEADLPAIKQTLDYLGTPYTVYLAAQTPNGLTPDKLANGCHGYYQGIILTNGQLSYYNGSAYVSALSQQEWTNLWSYEAQMGVRSLSWYTYPTADYGYQAPTGVADTSTTPLTASLTSTGHTTFSYMPGGSTVTIQNAYTYLANALTDGTTTPLLTDASGHALGLIRSYTDGRQVLSLTFDSNPNLIHSLVLSYGLINWLTKGLFLGERHVYMSPQVDDLFIDDSDWTSTTACGTPVDNTGSTYRMSGADWLSILNWQTGQRGNATTRNLTLTMAYNGYGTTTGAYTPDTLTPAVLGSQGQVYWVSHTYDHTNLDNVDTATATSEITQNDQVASTMHFTHFSPSNMVTPDVSGLTNPNFLQAAVANGIRYLVTDTSVAGYNNPSPNAGIYNSYQPQILMIPRHPNNLFYNVSTPDGWTAEYNCIYNSFWGRNLSYQEILNAESQVLVTYMLKGELDPWMFHQPNMRAYDGVHSLLGDLLALTLQKYQQYYNLAVMSPTMDQLGQTMAQRMQYNQAGVTASIHAGMITITAQQAVRVPVTGLSALGYENYGGQHISYVNLAAGQSITLPVQ